MSKIDKSIRTRLRIPRLTGSVATRQGLGPSGAGFKLLKDFEEKMVQRMLEGAAVAQLAKETGVASTTLFPWRHDRLVGRMADGDKDTPEVKTKRELTPMDKARLLAEADGCEREGCTRQILSAGRPRSRRPWTPPRPANGRRPTTSG